MPDFCSLFVMRVVHFVVFGHGTAPASAPGGSAPKGRRMGHAGAIVSASGESAAEKIELLQACGVGIIHCPSEFGERISAVLAK